MPARAHLAVIVTLAILISVVMPATNYGLRYDPRPPVQSSYTLTASPSQVAPGGQLNVSWTAPSGRPFTDWIALY